MAIMSPVPQDVQQYEWYIGDYSRQAVEEALRKENKVMTSVGPGLLVLSRLEVRGHTGMCPAAPRRSQCWEAVIERGISSRVLDLGLGCVTCQLCDFLRFLNTFTYGLPY